MKQKIYNVALSLILGCFLSYSFQSCSDDNVIIQNEEFSNPTINEFELSADSSKSLMLVEFAKVLSKVVYENQSVRELIKEEAMKEFDCNYDVLWMNIGNKTAGDASMNQIIAEYSSPEFIDLIQEKIPLLNILFPEIIATNTTAYTYDPTDEILPVILPGAKVNYAFYNGICIDTIPFGEIPVCNVLVLNENKRVKLIEQTRTGNAHYTFVNPAFDNTSNISMTRTGVSDDDNEYASLDAKYIGQDAIDSYKYFYTTDAGPNSQSYQRDYIYYGVTPESPRGSFNYTISEYISYIKVDHSCIKVIGDQTEDPQLKAYSLTKKKSAYSEEEFLNKVWTNGSFCFHIFVGYSNSETSQEFVVCASPSDLWDFQISTKRTRKAGIGNHSRWTTTIDSIIDKPFYVVNKKISLGGWNLSNEALERHVIIEEYDEEEDTTESNSYTFTKVTSNSVSTGGSYKYDENYSIDNNISSSDSKTATYTKTITKKRSQTSDALGSVTLKYNDPIIKAYLGNGIYDIKTYSTGSFEFGLKVSR